MSRVTLFLLVVTIHCSPDAPAFFCFSHPLLAIIVPYFDLFYLKCRGVVIKIMQPSSVVSTNVSINCALKPFLAKICMNQSRSLPCFLSIYGSRGLICVQRVLGVLQLRCSSLFVLRKNISSMHQLLWMYLSLICNSAHSLTRCTLLVLPVLSSTSGVRMYGILYLLP